MPELFVGNFDFEHQLADPSALPASGKVRRVASELAAVWLAEASDGDCLWMPEPPEAEFPSAMVDQGFPHIRFVSSEAELQCLLDSDEFQCTPWGWSSGIRQWVQRHRLQCLAPPLEAVRTANSRRFSFHLEKELDVALPRAAECHSVDECENALLELTPEEAWVIKSEFGMAARERILGRGPRLETSQIAWLEKRFRAGQAVFLEPWVQAVAEAGLQFDIPAEMQNAPRFLGIAPMITDPSGVYRGSRFDPAGEIVHDWSRAKTIGDAVARQVQELGYFGPLGLDAMWYRDRDGGVKLRPLQDLNARWTMGRLSLGFRSQRNPGESGIWRHLHCPATTPKAARAWWQTAQENLPADVRWIRTSPIQFGNQVTQHTTGLLMASNAERLHEALAGLD